MTGDSPDRFLRLAGVDSPSGDAVALRLARPLSLVEAEVPVDRTAVG